MKFATLFASLALASAVVAAPGAKSARHRKGHNCVSADDASDIIDQFITILSHPDIPAANATAQDLLADNFIEYSDSIDSLSGQPLGSASFGGKQGYIAGVLGAPGLTGINTLDIITGNCNKIVWYWLFTGVGTKQYEVKGINIFTINDGQIEQIDVEFNSIAWGLDIGFTVTPPPA